MTARLLIGPTVEPVTLAEAKNRLRYPATDQDAEITRMISSGRTETERYTGRAWLTQTWAQGFDTWPTTRVELVKPPCQQVARAVVYGADGTETTLPTTAYLVDTLAMPARVYFTGGPPVALSPAGSGLVVEVVAGYTTPDEVPSDIRELILAVVVQWFGQPVPPVEAWPQRFIEVMHPYRIVLQPTLTAAALEPI